ncbi:MAG: type II toxin-antitoxin system VapC family toxin [Defluviicoccus sp.]|nr:type II toxin-antitoxin system VapC family toxin [Defluviicoccus sp.]
MKLILDTDALSATRRPERAPRVAAWLGSQREEDLYFSVVSLGEIERGIALQSPRQPELAADLRSWIDGTVRLFADRVLPFGAEEARIWGRLSARLGHDGADLQIAATALAQGAVVVTGNVSDFEPAGVEVENPF